MAQLSHTRSPAAVLRGFSLLDLLVSISVIAVLIAILLPSISKVQETARRVVCQSNLRQLGIGLLMYADDNGGNLPTSVYQGDLLYPPQPQNMIAARVLPGSTGPALALLSAPRWDSLGMLFSRDYIPAPKVFYCPSHRGEYPYLRFAQTWEGAAPVEIITNYHYRGGGPSGHPVAGRMPKWTTNLHLIDPAQSSLIADGMRARSDINHRSGSNFFRADLTVHWFDDPSGDIVSVLPADKDNAVAEVVSRVWERFDDSVKPQ